MVRNSMAVAPIPAHLQINTSLEQSVFMIGLSFIISNIIVHFFIFSNDI